MSVEVATTSDISALYHATSDGLIRHGAPEAGDCVSDEVNGLPVAETANRYTMLLAGAAIAYVRETIGTFTPDGMLLRGVREVSASYEEPHLSAVPAAESESDETEYEYSAPKCRWEVDHGSGDIETVTVETGWDPKVGPTYVAKRSRLPRSKDERIGLMPTGKAEGGDGAAGTAEDQTETQVSRRLVRTLSILASHFDTVAEHAERVLFDALS